MLFKLRQNHHPLTKLLAYIILYILCSNTLSLAKPIFLLPFPDLTADWRQEVVEEEVEGEEEEGEEGVHLMGTFRWRRIRLLWCW